MRSLTAIGSCPACPYGLNQSLGGQTIDLFLLYCNEYLHENNFRIHVI